MRLPSIPTVAVCAGIAITINIGIRNSISLFFTPMTASFGWSRGVFSLAMALQHLFFGSFQPVSGWLADKFSAPIVMILGNSFYVTGLIGMALTDSAAVFTVCCGLICGLGLTSASYGVVLPAVAKAVEPSQRSFLISVASSIGSIGQLVFPLIAQALIKAIGWSYSFLVLSGFMCLVALASLGIPGAGFSHFLKIFAKKEGAIAKTAESQTVTQLPPPPPPPLVTDSVTAAESDQNCSKTEEMNEIELREFPKEEQSSKQQIDDQTQQQEDKKNENENQNFEKVQDKDLPIVLEVPTTEISQPPPTTKPRSEQTVKEALLEAYHCPSFWCLMFEFFICGFHTGFIGVHLPYIVAGAGLDPFISATALALLGLFNVFGTLGVSPVSAWMTRRYALAFIYTCRFVIIAIFAFLPISIASVLIFACVLGLLWLSTVPLTSGLVSLIFGPKWSSTIFGIIFFAHQIGAFIGSYLGGAIFDMVGSYLPIWIACLVLAALAAIVSVPILERPIWEPIPSSSD